MPKKSLKQKIWETITTKNDSHKVGAINQQGYTMGNKDASKLTEETISRNQIQPTEGDANELIRIMDQQNHYGIRQSNSYIESNLNAKKIYKKTHKGHYNPSVSPSRYVATAHGMNENNNFVGDDAQNSQ